MHVQFMLGHASRAFAYVLTYVTPMDDCFTGTFWLVTSMDHRCRTRVITLGWMPRNK